MGMCTSSYSTQPEGILDEFWSDIPLRNTNAEDFANFIQAQKSIQDISFNDFHGSLIKKFFLHPHFKKESQELFDSFLVHFGKNINRPVNGNEEINIDYALYLITMIFLCKPDSESAYRAACTIIKEFKIPMTGDLISREILTKILKIYICCISLMSIPYVKGISDNPEEFELYLRGMFKLQIQEIYIKSILLSHIKANTVRLYKFYCKDYLELTNDSQIRFKLYTLGKDEDSLKQRKTVLEPRITAIEAHREKQIQTTPASTQENIKSEASEI